MVTVDIHTRRRTRLTEATRRAHTIIGRDWFVFTVICVLAFCFYLYALGVPVIWYDESFSAIYAIQPLPVLWNAFNTGEMNMVLYYAILHVWVHILALFGVTATEVILRLPSAVFSALSAGVVFLLGRRFAGRAVGVAAASLYLFNRYPLYAAHQARSYGLLLLLVCLSWYALLALLSGRSGKRWWVWYIAVSALAIYAHIVSLLILLTQGGVVCLFCIIPSNVLARARSLLLPLGGAYALIGLLISPLAIVSFRNPTKTLWLGPPQLHDLPHLYVVYVTSGGEGVGRLVISAALLVGLAAWVISRLTWDQRLAHRISVSDDGGLAQSDRLLDRGAFVVALVCFVLIPVLAGYTVSRLSTQRIFSDRYLMTIVPGLDLLLGLCITTLRWPWMRTVVLLAVIVGTLMSAPTFYATSLLEGWRTPTNWLIQRFQRGDGVVCDFRGQYTPGCQDYQFEYYLYYFHANDLASYIATNSAPPPVSDGSWAGLPAYAARHPRLFFVAGNAGSQRDAAQQQSVQQWLDSHYRLIDQVSDKQNTVRMYDTSVGAVALGSPSIPLPRRLPSLLTGHKLAWYAE